MGNESEEDGDDDDDESNYIETKATAKRMLGLERLRKGEILREISTRRI
jgi:hypothetical protein